jgi:predicted  nucleic acid-binding Zn-ribbon protein
MLKKLIEPLQKVLLSRHLCPGCTRSLDDQKDREIRANATERITCECGRIYIYDKEMNTYRRALEHEI